MHLYANNSLQAYPILEKQNKKKSHEGNEPNKDGSVDYGSGDFIGSGIVGLQ